MHSSAQELQDQITADRIKMLYGGTWGSIVTQLIVAAIFAMIQSIQVQRGSLVVWYAALAVTLLSRGLLERRHFPSTAGHSRFACLVMALPCRGTGQRIGIR